MNTLRRIGWNALIEWMDAIRSRRALVLLALYLVSAVGCMYGTISIFEKMEGELAQVLQLPEAEQTGVVSQTLWKSKPFQRIVRSVVSDELVYNDIRGRHPVELVYAWFVFLGAPFLVILVAGNRVSDDLRSGAVRFALVRCTRAEWSIGKCLGLAALIAGALVVGAVGAWVVAVCRLSGVGALGLVWSMLGWGLRAWVYTLAWLGLALGVSHVTQSGSRATALGIFALVGLAILPAILQLCAKVFECPWLMNFELLAPSSAKHFLWRQGVAPLTAAAVHLVALGGAYFVLGFATFNRRDA